MKKFSRLAALFVLATPFLAAAQSAVPGGINDTYVKGYATSITSVINTILVPVLMAIAFITFLWGVYKYFILGAAEEKSLEEGRQFIMWGLIGFVVITSVWGLVNIVGGTLGLQMGASAPTPPTFGTQ